MEIKPQNDYIAVREVSNENAEDKKLFVIVGGTKPFRVLATPPDCEVCKKGDLVILTDEPETVRINDEQILFTTKEKVRGVLSGS